MTMWAEAIKYGDFVAPAGTVVANVVVSFTGSDGVAHSVTAPADAATVSIDLAADTYAVTAQAVDATGANVGPAATATEVVPAPATVTVQIPTGLSGAPA